MHLEYTTICGMFANIKLEFAMFQDEVDEVAMQLAKASLELGESNNLIYHSMLGTGEKVVSVLDTKL